MSDVELSVSIDPEQINKYIAERVLESSIGEALQGAVDKAVKELGSSWNNPFDGVVASLIQQEAQRMIREEFAEEIKEVVRKRVTEEFTAELLDKAFTRFAEGRWQ